MADTSIKSNSSLSEAESASGPSSTNSKYRSPWVLALYALAAYIIFTRLWNLGLKPVQHDESMFGYWSWLIFDKMPKGMDAWSWEKWKAVGQGYNYMPILHGPVLEWVTAFVFKIFGDNDYTLRFFPALCGLGIFWILYLLRDQIGERSAYLAILFLAISPNISFVTRYIRPDLPMFFNYMLIIHAGMRYAKKPSALMMGWLMFLVMLATCVHETYVIFYFLIVTFALGCVIHGFVRSRSWSEVPFARECVTMIKRYHWAAAIIGISLGVFFSWAIMTSFWTFPQHWFGQKEAWIYWTGQHTEHRIRGEFHFHLLHLALYEIAFTIFWASCMIAAMWPSKPSPSRSLRRILFWMWIFGSWLILLIPLSTGKGETVTLWAYRLPAAFETKYHISMGLHIWLFAQVLFVIMFVGWKHLDENRYFLAFCDYWAGGSFLAYSYAGEKVPWVTAHIVLPMLISCGIYANDVWRNRFELLREIQKAPAKKKAKAASEHLPSPASDSWRMRAGILALAAIGFGWTFWTSTLLTFIQPGSPIERLTYASSHTRFHGAMHYIMRECEENYQGTRTPIAFGGTLSWPLHWTLRNYKNLLEFSVNEKGHTFGPNEERLTIRTKEDPSKPVEPQFVIIDNDMMDAWAPRPLFRPRYDWGRIPGRHYWTPEPLKWDTMKRVWLLLGNESSLESKEKELLAGNQAEKAKEIHKKLEDTKLCRKEWVKFLTAYFIRDEELSKNGKPREWRSVDGYYAYFGRLKPESEMAPPAVPVPPATTTLPPAPAADPPVTIKVNP